MLRSREKRLYGMNSLSILVAMIVQALIFPSLTHAGTFTEVIGFGSNPGNLKMYTYVPDAMPAEAPLIVSLHGCTQTANVYSSNGWIDLADKWSFYVLFPEQQRANNPNSCFNWFQRSDSIRGVGEAKSIRSMVEKMKSDHPIDDERIFIEGLSAGGYMTAAMLAAYPDVFVAGGINAGGPAYSAPDIPTAFSCMAPGCDKSPGSWGDLVRMLGYSEHTGPWPRVSIWHGTNDSTVKIMNQRELVEQWTNVHGIDGVPDKEDTVRGHNHKQYHDSQGAALVETYSITGMGHATPIDPGFSAANGCGRPGAFIEDKGICGVFYIASFWGLGEVAPPCSADNQPPTITLKGNAKIRLEVGDLFTDEGALASDPEDGNISANVLVTGTVNTSEPATYVLKYNVSDSEGCKAHEVTRTIVVGLCEEWTETNYGHEASGRAYSSWSWIWIWPFYVTNYYVVGSDEPLGMSADAVTIRKEDPGKEYYEKGFCPQ